MAQSDWIEDVRSRVNLVEIVQAYTTLVSRGRTWRGPCPLHQGTDPNFSVDPARGSYRCFVCDEHGDAFSFVMKVEGVQFLDAAKKLAEMVGVTVPEKAPRRRSPEAIARGQEQTRLVSNLNSWASLGLQSVAESGGGGVAPDGTLTIPYGPLDAPDGWVHYGVVDGTPVRQGPMAPGLVWAPGARLHVHERPLVIVSEAILAWRLAAHGIPAVAVGGVVNEGSLVTAEQAQQISRSGAREVVLGFFPGRGEPDGWRALFATEATVLTSGVEPLWSRPIKDAETAWDWAATDGLDAALGDPERTRPLFAWRVAQMVQAQRQGRLERSDLPGKIASSLGAVLASGDRVRYQAYLAWAARELGVRERGFLVVSSGMAEADEF